jgi:transposase
MKVTTQVSKKNGKKDERYEINAYLCRMEEMVTIPRSEYEQMKAEIARLSALVERLMEEIALLKNGRNSKTSSTAPSQDIGRSNLISLRGKSNKKSGGQPGHKGHTLLMKDNPDEVMEHAVSSCSGCGQCLEVVEGEMVSRRQEIEIPVVAPRYIEHRRLVKVCPCCGLTNEGLYPADIKAPVQYGRSVKSLVAYLSVYQFLPYQRLCQLFSDLFSLPLSEGSIDNILEDISQKSEAAYNEIQARIAKSEVVGADETGCRVNGKKHWFHVWQNKFLTFIVSFKSRGHQVIEEYFPGSFLYYVSDCWASQLKTTAQRHQLCLAHLLRELLNFEKALKSDWCIRLQDLFRRAIELKKRLTADDYRQPHQEVLDIEQELDELLKVDCSHFNSKLQALVKRLIKHRHSIFTFLYHPDVPADNNASERAIRMVKVKTKVSGQFRNADGKGADRYARIRSVIDTTIKNGQDVYTALVCLANVRLP